MANLGSRLLETMSVVLTKHRLAVLAALCAITAALAVQIPKIAIDPAPENLINSFEGQARWVNDNFRRNFGDSSRVLVVLVSGGDVLSTPALQFQHDIALHFRGHPRIEKVEGLTVLSVPRRVAAPPAPEQALDLEALEALEAEEGSAEDDFEPGVYNALLELTEADPEHFPGGIDELGPALQDELRTNPVVDGARVPETAGAEIRAALAGAPLLVRRIVSDDATVAAVALFVKDIPARKMPEVVADLRTYLASHQPPAGMQASIAGLPYLRASMVEQMRKDQLVLVPITVLVCALLLYLSMRWWPGVLLPLAAVVICAVWTVGGMAMAHEPLNVLNNLIPPLLIIIGISEAIHIVERYREELARSGDRLIAGKATVTAMAVACFLTTLTTAVGFASLLVSKTVMLRHFGLTSAIGVMLSYVVTMAFVPPVLTWMTAPPPASEKTRGRWLDAVIVAITASIVRKPYFALAGTFTFLVACFVMKQWLVVDHALLDQFRPDDPVHVSTLLMEEHLDGIRPLEVLVDVGDAETFDRAEVLAAVADLEAWAKRDDGVLSATSYVDVLRQSLALLSGDAAVWTTPFASDRIVVALRGLLSQREPNPLHTYRSRDGRMLRLQIKLKDIGAQSTLRFLVRFEAEAKRRLEAAGLRVLPNDRRTHAESTARTLAAGEARLHFTGEAYTGSRGQEAVINDLWGSLMTAVLLIFLQVSLLFRSARLGLLCIPPNLVPLAGTVAYMVVRGIPLNTATVIIFSISIGLADYGTIHVLSRFQEEVERGLNASGAIMRAARGTGRAVIVANLTLMAGFGVLLLSRFRPVQHFGELIAVTVAGCLISTLFMQPALLRLWGLSRAEKERQRGEMS